MLLDIETPFSNAYETDHEFKEALLAVSKFQVNRGEVTTWASHLRFLTPAIGADSAGSRAADTIADAKGGHESELAEPEPSLSTSEGSSKEYCICSERSYKSFDETSRQLQLTKSSELPDCVHYVAVSYCWSSTPFSRPKDVGREIQEYSINTEHGSRSNKASSSILDRAILFASRRGSEFIWIDQECIEQDNPIDQRDGIQAMDLVYQRAEESVGLLNIYVEKQEHLDALNLMFEGEGIEPHELESLAEVLEFICSDAWFTRAWILQESTSAGSEMTLLIRCAPQLYRTTYFSNGSDHYFEVSLFQLHVLLSSWLPTTIESMAEDVGEELYNRISRVMDRWFSMVPPESFSEYDPDKRLACNAAEALCFLGKRQNSIVADRLAILANLCNYEVRLDSNELDRLGYNFSICAFVLSILNGDMSLLNGHVEMMQGQRGKVDFLESDNVCALTRRPGYTWCPPASANLDGMVYLERDKDHLRTSVISLTETGLLVQGWLWVVDHKIDVSAVIEKLCVQRGQSIVEQSMAGHIDRTLAVEAFVSLLCYLHKRAYHGLVNLIWTYLRRRMLPDDIERDPQVALYSKASLKDIYDVNTEALIWPNPMPKRPGSTKHTDPFQSLDFSFPGKYFAPWLIQTVLSKRTISVGHLAHSNASLSDYVAFFEDQSLGLFFSPCTNYGNELVHTQYRWFPMSWKVDKTNVSTSDEEPVLQCHGLQCGAWIAEESWSERVIIS